MKLRHLLPLAALASPWAAPAYAEPARAEPARAGQRVLTLAYRDAVVVPVNARAGFESTIRFAEGERVENIAIGDSAGWQVTPNRRANLVFVKPVTATAPVTNMTVVTDRYTYLFELRNAPRQAPVFLLSFTYPAPPAMPAPLPDPARTAIAQPAGAAEALAALAGPDSAPSLAARINFAWRASGDRNLQPERSFDDGASVYLSWPAGRDLPAVLAIGPDGKTEGPVNYAVVGDYLVVDGLHPRLILRSGKAVATVEPIAPRPGPAPAVRTASK